MPRSPFRRPGPCEPAGPDYAEPVRTATMIVFCCLTAATATLMPCPAQVEVDVAEVLERVRAGGRFEDTKWRRGDDGQLEMHYFADVGMELAGPLRFRPLLGEDLERGLQNAGLFGLLALFCHGPDDLLAMTDAAFHLGALGVDTSDVGLRQYLALSPRAFEDDATGRAELMERMLAIDLLVKRGCRAAVAELTAIAGGGGPAALRERARHAIARLEGREPEIERRRLTPEALNLPLRFDAAVLVDHARLPGLGWLTPLAGRLGALVTAAKIEMAGGMLTAAQCNGAQAMADIAGELPFGLALRYGNARLDHSCLLVSVNQQSKLGVALSWQAAGAIEAEGWQDAAVGERTVRNNPMFGGRLTVAADRVQATVGGGAGRPRAAMARELLAEADAAIRVIVPKTSNLWPALRVLDLPGALGAELRITCGDPAVVVCRIEARDEDGADEWVESGKALLAEFVNRVRDQVPPELGDDADVGRLLAAVAGAAVVADGSHAVATVELLGVTPALVARIAEAVALRPFR